jgi:Transcriptional regulators
MNQKDIAKIAGVSSATISRVINQEPSVSQETYEHVMEIINQYGYVQNAIARNLKKSSTKIIGYLVPDIKNPFFTSVLAGFEEMCYKKGFDIIFENTNENVEKEKQSMQTLLRYRVDGLLAVFVDSENQYISSFESMGIPIVRIDRKSNYEMNNDCILIDNFNAMKLMVDHLVSFGHKDIAIAYGPVNITPGEERLKGFYMAMKSAGLTVKEEYVVPGYFTEGGTYNAVLNLLKLKKRPTALITTNNLSTVGAYMALSDQKIGIPEEISLIGLDNFPLATHLNPPITIIRRATTEVGKIAGEMLLERIELGEKSKSIPPRMRILETHLCEGKSCGKPRS